MHILHLLCVAVTAIQVFGASIPHVPKAVRSSLQATKEFDAFDPKGPALLRNRYDQPWVPVDERPRRNRKSEVIRGLVRENSLTSKDLIYPLFIHDDKTVVDIPSMPDCQRHSLDSMMKEVEDAMKYGVRTFILFPKIADNLKSNMAEESYNEDGLVPRAVRMIKEKYGDKVIVCTDVALDPYSSMGHDGVVEGEKIVNDVTVMQLQKQAVMQARAGSDIVAPSDMMDGRIGAIRAALDSEGFTDTSIMAYSAKYASAFYGPFRDALESHPGFGDKKTYQMDPANSKEAVREGRLDESEGADMLMVKPGMPYLDIIHRLKSECKLPVAAYHVSGEYAMLKAAARNGWLDEKKSVLEALLCFKRAGTDMILTYYAKQAAKWLYEDAAAEDAMNRKDSL